MSYCSVKLSVSWFDSGRQLRLLYGPQRSGVYLLPVEYYLWATVFSGVCLLQHGLSSATLTSRCTCSGEAVLMGHNAFRGVPAMSQTYPQPQALWGVLVQPHAPHWGFKLYLLPHWLTLGPHCLQSYTCRSTTATMFRGVRVLMCAHPWSQMLQGLLLHVHRSLWLKFAPWFQSV